MSGVLTWFFEMIVCSGILYANYYFLLQNNRFHSYNRYYLLAAVVLSILVPFVHIPVEFGTSHGKPAAIWQTLTAISSVAENKHIQIASQDGSTLFTAKNVLILFYVATGSIIFARFMTAIIFIGKLLRKYKAERTANIYFVNTVEPTTPFSFFKWLFWNNKIELQTENGQQIFRHELFHIQQKHSWDLTFLELTTAVFWINPFFHLIKKEVKTIHEFLADEFATKENDKWSYAELLLIRVLDSSSHRLVNPFFHNQIKRRIAMITSSKTPKYQFFRKLMILPICILVFALFAFRINQHSKLAVRPIQPLSSIMSAALEPKPLASSDYMSEADTTKPTSKQKAKANSAQKDINDNKIENQKELTDFKRLVEEKQLEIRKAQEEFKLLMMEKQAETEKAQEQFKKMIEATEAEAQGEAQQRFKQLMAERQKEDEEYQEEFKKMMTGKQQDAQKSQEEFKKMMEFRQREAQKNGEEKFKQMMEEMQKESTQLREEFKKLMMMRQKETEKSQEEFKKLLEQRQLEMQKLQEEFKKRMLEQNKKQVI